MRTEGLRGGNYPELLGIISRDREHHNYNITCEGAREFSCNCDINANQESFPSDTDRLDFAPGEKNFCECLLASLLKIFAVFESQSQHLFPQGM